MVPKIIFVVPYRDRESHKYFFDIYMKHVLEDINDYEIVFSFQDNNLPFNRGGMKNLGFIYIKKKYPSDYKNMTFVFHDVDTIPYKKGLLDYETTRGTIKHFYGYTWALGGIVSITGHDFEVMDGFPNYWGWGFEDNELQRRAIKNGITINREVFFDIKSNKILHFYDDFIKKISRTQLEQEASRDVTDGLSTLLEINQYWNDEDKMLYNTSFSCEFNPVDIYQSHQIGDGNKLKVPRRFKTFKRSTDKSKKQVNTVYSFLQGF
jgi:hypothetical protein